LLKRHMMLIVGGGDASVDGELQPVAIALTDSANRVVRTPVVAFEQLQSIHLDACCSELQ